VSRVSKITIDFREKSVAEVLDVCLKDSRLCYELVNKTIVIRVRPEDDKKSAILQGTVVDRDSTPLPGVTIRLKGTSVGTATDSQGGFKLTIPTTSSKVTLVFSFIGMKQVEKEMQVGVPMRIVMEEETAEVEEVIVNGYFSRSKESYTGSQVTIKAEDLKKIGTLDVTEASSLLFICSRVWLMDRIRIGSRILRCVARMVLTSGNRRMTHVRILIVRSIFWTAWK